MITDNSEKRVFVTRALPAAPLKRLAAAARVEIWDNELPPPPGELLARLRDAAAVLSMVTDRLDAAAIAAAPHLRVISNFGVGVDNIDLAAATRAQIPVGHTPGVLTETTADLAFALLIAAARRTAEADRYVRQGRWVTWGPQVMLGRDVYGATLGIVGWGAIGQAMARRGAGFGMRILYATRAHGHPAAAGAAAHSGASAHSPLAPSDNVNAAGPPAAARVEFAQLLAESDFVSLHVPLNSETHHLIGAAELSAMKPGAILINTARGQIVDQPALAAALQSGHLGGAGLDVTAPEPISLADPLLQLDNVVITPHIGSASHATRLKMAELAVDNLLDAFAGRIPRYCANPAVVLRSGGPG